MNFRQSLFLITLLSALFQGCAPSRLFFYPNRVLYQDPAKLGIPCEIVAFPSLNGKTLSGILFQTSQPPKGLVVHFHGNFGNVSNHFLNSFFLTRYGFDVLIFDYQGFGASEGSPSPKRLVEDGIAAIRYAQTRLRNPAGGVVVFGQSLGGAVGIVSAAREPRVRAAVIEFTFSSYRGMGRDVLKRSVLTWLAYPILPLFLPGSVDPEDFVAQISPRPLLLIHGTQDRKVPSWMSERLYEKAREPKRLWLIEGAGHDQCRQMKGEEYERTIADFFRNALESPRDRTTVTETPHDNDSSAPARSAAPDSSAAKSSESGSGG